MNRNNIWVHIGLAVVLVSIAAVIGQIDRWRTALKVTIPERAPVAVRKQAVQTKLDSIGDAEVLVRFKPGVNLSMIRAAAAAHHDKVVDEIETVSGLVAIDDLDDADPTAVAEESI